MENAHILKLPLNYRMALHVFETLETAPFDVREYSRMKFGSDRVAKIFGYAMAEKFYQDFPNIVSTPCVVIPAPSTTVSVAATLLSRHFTNRLNSLLASNNQKSVEWSMIHRNMTYNNNYADLPKSERKKLLARDTIYINREYVRNKFLIFIDDCTITGTHEEKISSFLVDENLNNEHAFVCFAKYQGDDSSIEMRLNHADIQTAYDLVRLAHETHHNITTRSLRLLLEHPVEDFTKLLDSAPAGFIEASYHAAITKGYNVHPPYVENFNHLSTRMNMGRLLG